MIDLRIRYAMPEDIHTLNALISDSLHALSNSSYTPQQIEDTIQFIYNIDKQLIEDGSYFIAEINHEIVGCGGWSKRKKSFRNSPNKNAAQGVLLNPASDPARVCAFFVHPTWIRKGIGRQLMKLCELEARRAGFTRLELTTISNGHLLYIKCGFHIVKLTRIRVSSGTYLPVLRMAKTLI